jgi:hypothetical protein
MPAFANWTQIGLTYLLVLIAILLVLVLVATYFTWNKAKPLHSKSKSGSSSSSSSSIHHTGLCATDVLPPVMMRDAIVEQQPYQFFDDEPEPEEQIEAKKEDLSAALQVEIAQLPKAERLLPSPEAPPSKPPGSFYKYVISNKLLPLLQDYEHPGFIVTYHPACGNHQQAFHDLTAEFGNDLTQSVSRHFEHKLSLRGFHIKTLTNTLKDGLLKHPLVGDIHEDGWVSLALPPHNVNESQVDKEAKVRKLKSLATQQIVPWSVVRVGGKASSLKLGSKQARAAQVYDKIAVFTLDSGLDMDHGELTKGIWSRSFLPGLNPNLFNDEHGHGTHVAGIISAQDNGVGVVGTCPGIPIHAIKVLDRNGMGTLSSIIDGLNYCYELALKHPEKKFIANLSLGTNEVSPLMDAAVIRASDKISIVCAAGNDRTDVNSTSPARTALQYSTVAVGAFDQRNCFSTYSNFGQGLTVLAPGDNILSTYKNNSFAYLSGTSMAAPCVTGVLAAYLSVLPDDLQSKETPRTLKQKLHTWATQATAQENQIVSLRPGSLTCSRSVYMKF